MRFNISEKERNVIEHFKYIFSYVFQALLFIFLITLLLQQFYPTFVNSRININWFMLVVIIFGAISILFPPKPIIKNNQKATTIKDYILILVLGIVGGLLVFIKTKNLGWISYVISVIAGLIIIFLSYLIMNEKDEENE